MSKAAGNEMKRVLAGSTNFNLWVSISDMKLINFTANSDWMEFGLDEIGINGELCRDLPFGFSLPNGLADHIAEQRRRCQTTDGRGCVSSFVFYLRRSQQVNGS